MEFKLVSCMTKVFADSAPQEEPLRLSVLKGETASFQLAAWGTGEVQIDLEAQGFKTRVREVCLVPVVCAVYPHITDSDFLRRAPGMYPDLLKELEGPATLRGWWKSFWIDADPDAALPGGDYPITVKVKDRTGETVFETVRSIHVVDAKLPPQTLMHTNWFYCDCLADYYRVPVFSEEHWKIVENFLRSAVRMGVNMLLTPLFTPPLDTGIGLERTTVQLVDIFVDSGKYSFHFDKLERWVNMAKDCGIRYFEICHLFSQWGSNKAPKIMATVDGTYRQIFGWEDEATDEPYKAFLAAFLPEVVAQLKKLGIADCSRFHISDEPREHHLDIYRQQRAQVVPYIEGIPLMDAMSHYSFFEQGLTQIPAVATSSPDMDLFLANKPEEFWLYYCCSQQQLLANRTMAMPMNRVRILGTQLYHYGAAGFLHWGFNFYNSQFSIRHIDPYAVTDCDACYPSGDAFVVYPGADGEPEESIRYMSMRQADHDMRALQLLESLAGRERVEELIMEDTDGVFTLKHYPRNGVYLPTLRLKVNAEIEKYL